MWYRCKLTKEHALSSFTLYRTSSRVVSTLPEQSRSRPLHPSRLQIQSKRWDLGKFCHKLSHSQPMLSISIPCTYDLKQVLSLVWKHSLGIQLSAAPLCSNSRPRDLAQDANNSFPASPDFDVYYVRFNPEKMNSIQLARTQGGLRDISFMFMHHDMNFRQTIKPKPQLRDLSGLHCGLHYSRILSVTSP